MTTTRAASFRTGTLERWEARRNKSNAASEPHSYCAMRMLMACSITGLVSIRAHDLAHSERPSSSLRVTCSRVCSAASKSVADCCTRVTARCWARWARRCSPAERLRADRAWSMIRGCLSPPSASATRPRSHFQAGNTIRSRRRQPYYALPLVVRSRVGAIRRHGDRAVCWWVRDRVRRRSKASGSLAGSPLVKDSVIREAVFGFPCSRCGGFT